MKIAISYPPLESNKGVPLLSQNRQFQWFSDATFIYPVVPAQAATLLMENDYAVFWDDGIAEKLSYADWLERIVQAKPDLIAIETKTPVIKKHWAIIDELKEQFKIKNLKLRIVLLGDHVTANPEESLENSSVDYVLTGGDYDFALLNLANHLTKSEPLEGGVWYRGENGEISTSGSADIAKHNLESLPVIDRKLTRWELYSQANGNFKLTPGAYMMSGRDCWWGMCSFCSWTTLFPQKKYRAISAKKALDEVGHLIDLGVREIMEDSGTLPIGDWLLEFCQGMISRGYNKKVVIDCNMRLNAIRDAKVYQLMKRAGFRMILFGFESANQATLDRLNKNLKIEEVEPALAMCSRAGLEPHLTVMIGYPWETQADAENSLNFVKKLFAKGLLSSLQATLLIPYPGTPLYEYCRKNGLLLTEEYDRFDQSERVMKAEMSEAEIKKMIRNFYRSFLTPKFILQKIVAIHNLDEVKFAVRAGLKIVGHLKDFSRKKNN